MQQNAALRSWGHLTSGEGGKEEEDEDAILAKADAIRRERQMKKDEEMARKLAARVEQEIADVALARRMAAGRV